jgi:ATP-dependent Clp protease ATP-binding subunit ClpA
MFERFTTPARTVVAGAQQEARQLRSARIGTEHLLIAMLDPAAGTAATVLAAAGLDAAAVRADAVRMTGTTATLDDDDAAALKSIGIDLPAVLARIADTFRADVATAPTADARGGRWRRAGGGQSRLTPRAKKVLELSLREAIALHSSHIGSEHLLLGLLRDGNGLAAKVLTERGISLDQLRRSTLAALDQAA